MKKIIVILSLTIASLLAEVTIDQVLPHVTLDGENGGNYDGTPWSSQQLQGKTTMLMYVDPDERSKGEVFKPTIAGFEKDLDFNKFQIIVIINLNATWKPNAVIKKMMKSKVDTNTKRHYVLDTNSVLVKKWTLPNDEYNTLIIDKNGKVIYQHAGEWHNSEMKKVDALVRNSVH